MSAFRQATLTLVAAMGLATSAAAHPGHGAAEPASGLLHYLTEPLHVAAGALAIGIALAAAHALAQRAARREAKTRRG